jgi:hypothetical protein
MVVSLRHVGITDWDKERLKMTVNMPTSCACSENAPWNAVRPDGLMSFDLIKNFTFGAPEWRSGLRHYIAELEASQQTLVRSRAVSQLAVI